MTVRVAQRFRYGAVACACASLGILPFVIGEGRIEMRMLEVGNAIGLGLIAIVLLLWADLREE